MQDNRRTHNVGDLIMSRKKAILMMVLAAAMAMTMSGCNALHLLTFQASPADSGDIKVTPDQTLFFAGKEVTLEAVAHEGWEFRQWVGQGMNTTANPTRFRVYADQVVTAMFVPVGTPSPDEGESPMPDNIVLDGGFEQGVENSPWTALSSTGTPVICRQDACGLLNGMGSASGAYWAWMGNDLTFAAEYATLFQNVAVSDYRTASLSFNIAVPKAENPFRFLVFINDKMVFSLTEADASRYASYVYEELDVSDWLGRDSALVYFVYSSAGEIAKQSAVFLDNVAVILN